MLQRFTQVGEFYVIDPRIASDKPDYTGDNAAIMIYDEVRDLVSITKLLCFAMLRLHYSPRSPRGRCID